MFINGRDATLLPAFPALHFPCVIVATVNCLTLTGSSVALSSA